MSKKLTGLPTTMEEVFAFHNTTKEAFGRLWSGRADYDIAEEEKRLMCLALNGGKKMDVADTDQWKYFPVFKVIKDISKPSGFALSCHGYDCASTFAYLRARHGLDSPELVRHAAEHFVEVYERAMV